MKKLFTVLILCACSLCSFAEDIDIYRNAPDQIKKLIAETDKLIEQKKYQSAFGHLGSDDSDYIIYKKTEICTNWFVQSLMHSMFVFKDLEENEDLMELRRNFGDESYSMTYYSPEEAVENYVSVHGQSPFLNLALAQYYSDCFLRYGSSWIKKSDELFDLINSNFDAAYAAGVYNFASAEKAGTACIYMRKYEKCIHYYETALKLKDDSGMTWYNLAVAFMYSQKYPEAVQAAANAIKHPEDTPSQQMDAYSLLSDAYYLSGNADAAAETLEKLKEKFPDSSFPYMQAGGLCLKLGKKDAAYAEFDCAFKKQTDVRCYDSVITYYMKSQNADEAIRFTKGHLDAAENNSYLKFILNYYLMQLYAETDDKKQALEQAELSLTLLKDAASLSEDVRASYEGQIKKYQARLSK
ncbi:MAG: hypothetical protein J6Y93_00295 [Treponema sp.]|nr:hypothetical protein [Treponema sp.]